MQLNLSVTCTLQIYILVKKDAVNFFQRPTQCQSNGCVFCVFDVYIWRVCSACYSKSRPLVVMMRDGDWSISTAHTVSLDQQGLGVPEQSFGIIGGEIKVLSCLTAHMDTEDQTQHYAFFFQTNRIMFKFHTSWKFPALRPSFPSQHWKDEHGVPFIHSQILLPVCQVGNVKL